jgi:long-chain fatty acid transport protein
MKKHFLAASFVMSAITSFGAGYQVNLEGLRQVAMGGTGTAWPWDVSTIFYNPGGLARLHGIQAYGCMSMLMPSTAFANNTTSGTKSVSVNSVRQTFTPFSVYVGGPIQEDSRIALGLGIYTPFGSGLKWDDNWLGKYMVQSISLKSVFFQPTISYKISEGLAVGAGFVYAAGNFDYTAALPVHGVAGPNQAVNGDGSVNMNGSANGIGFNAGIHLKASDDLQFGLSYRSQVNMNIGGGNATFKVPNSLRDSFPNTNFDSQLPLPQVISFGLGWRVSNLTLQFDLNYTGWNSYDSLRFNFSQHTSTLKDIRQPRMYQNTLTARLGAHYKISDIVSVMAGGAYDPSPVTEGFVSPDLPDADRIVVSCGATVKPLPRFTIIASFEGVSSATRQSAYEFGGFNGVYKTLAVAPGLAIYYKF